MSTFELILRTPEGELYNSKVKSVALVSEEGSLVIYANHASLTATLNFSPIVIEEADGTTDNFIARNGLLLFNNSENTADLMALHCERRSEISHKTALEYLAFIEEQLKNKENLNDIQVLYLEGEKLAVEVQMKDSEL